MPLDGSGPSAMGVSGSPVDQFSFLESEDSHLNVLVRSDTAGDGMWGAEVAAGDVALMRMPLSSFSDGSERAAFVLSHAPETRRLHFSKSICRRLSAVRHRQRLGYPQKRRKRVCTPCDGLMASRTSFR